MAATAFPPQNKKAAISPCKNFLFVSRPSAFIGRAQRSQIKKSAECRTKDMTKAERKRLKKNGSSVAKMAVGKSKTTNENFSKRFCFCQLPCAFFFQLLECSFWRGLWSALTNKKCLHTASSLCQASLAGFARWLHLRGIILLGGVSVSPLSTPRCGPVCISRLCQGSCAPYKFVLP
jgi:hypothetical protein